MMHIQYILDKSNNHGIGLFAAENVNEGQLIYTSSPMLDVNITDEQFQSLSEAEKKEVRYWGFPIHGQHIWHVDFDVSRFINHSYEANITQDENKIDAYLIAVRDIKKGEELTQNYLEFESIDDVRSRGIQ